MKIIYLLLLFLLLANKAITCSPYGTPLLTNQTTVGTDLVLNWTSTTSWSCSYNVITEIYCSPAAVGAPLLSDQSVCINKTSSGNQAYPSAQTIDLSSLCPGETYYIRAKEASCGSTFGGSQWSTFTSFVYGVAAFQVGINSTSLSICPGACVDLTAVAANNCQPTVDYTWSNGLGTSPTVNVCPVATSTTYSVTATTVGICATLTATEDITITVVNIPPTASNPLTVNVQCFADIPAPDPLVVTDETSTGAPAIVTWEDDVSDLGSCPETITRRYRITDECGVFILVSQLIIINDTQAPTAQVLDNAYQCLADVPAQSLSDVTNILDNCTANPSVGMLPEVQVGACPLIITRQFNVTDDCGNQIILTQTITVNDLIPPTASNVVPISVPLPTDVPAPNPSVVNDEADNCTVNPVVAWVSDVSDGNICNLEKITRTYSVTDDCGNQIFVTQEITILLVPAPISENDTLVCLGDFIALVADNPWNVPISWDNGVIDSQPFSPTQSMTYTVTADNFGCISTATATIDIENLPTVDFTTTQPVCEPFTVTFTNLSTAESAIVSCIWDIEGSVPTEECSEYIYTFLGAGVYDAGLTITSFTGCVNSIMYTDLLTVIAMPIASFEASELQLSTLDNEEEIVFTNNSEFSVGYEWNFGDGSPMTTVENPVHVFSNENPGTFNVELIAINSIGCTDTANVAIVVLDELVYFIPNTFTPDNDAFNNSFQPVFVSGYDPYDFDMYIFNRWGELIFESHDASVGWDGTYRGKMMENGTYTWKIEFKQTRDDERHMIIGHVNIIK